MPAPVDDVASACAAVAAAIVAGAGACSCVAAAGVSMVAIVCGECVGDGVGTGTGRQRQQWVSASVRALADACPRPYFRVCVLDLTASVCTGALAHCTARAVRRRGHVSVASTDWRHDGAAATRCVALVWSADPIAAEMETE